ncbi:MAG TPA: iron-containing redox enzyme family protein [Gemmatimonadaceae bacterium]|nr:iron-containing redox enzyme family protein [Gemmatimonadaceae bacterium]
MRATSRGDNDITASHLTRVGVADVDDEDLLPDRPAAVATVDGDGVRDEDDESEAPPPHSAQHLELPAIRLLTRGDAAADDDDDAALPERLRTLLAAGPLDDVLADEPPDTEDVLVESCRRVAARAYPADRVTGRQVERWIDHAARTTHHRALLAIYQQHMRLPQHGMATNQFHPLPCRLMSLLEAPWERDMIARARVRHDLSPAALPADPDAFVAWYRAAAFTHPLYEHDLYSYLASEADRAAVEWFLRMESAGEAAFDDLVALGQVGTRGEVKIEMASNYWDEMGNGKSHKVHTHMFHRLVEGLAITSPAAEELPWQVLSGVNAMIWSCLSRRNAFRAQGALGAVELLAPQRCTRLVHGALRVGIAKRTMSYYGAHAIIDVGHAEGWLAHVVRPQVAELPESRVGIAEGLLVRADASLDYFDWSLGEMRKR